VEFLVVNFIGLLIKIS